MGEVMVKEEVKNYICDKEAYLKFKTLQKQIAKDGKIIRLSLQDYYKKRREFYHSKGINVPNHDQYDPSLYDADTGTWADGYERDGFHYNNPFKPINTELNEARYINVIYGILKGREYKNIETKVRKDNELKRCKVQYIGQKYGLMPSIMDIICRELGLW